ncbi:tetratricopeptide repeat protein [Streptomyces sp. NPDC002187]|uniref:tetratricopeptide repeat protein n=1 Tax=Streptomyces sp. NPDC002187 TaxID=3364637 RepID=UPI00369C8EAF
MPGRGAAYQACWYLTDRGNTPTALPRLQQLHRTWTQQLGPDHESTLWVAHCLARAYHDIRNHTQARTLAEDLLTRRQRVLGKDHPDTLTSAHNIERPKADGSA